MSNPHQPQPWPCLFSTCICTIYCIHSYIYVSTTCIYSHNTIYCKGMLGANSTPNITHAKQTNRQNVIKLQREGCLATTKLFWLGWPGWKRIVADTQKPNILFKSRPCCTCGAGSKYWLGRLLYMVTNSTAAVSSTTLSVVSLPEKVHFGIYKFTEEQIRSVSPLWSEISFPLKWHRYFSLGSLLSIVNMKCSLTGFPYMKK